MRFNLLFYITQLVFFGSRDFFVLLSFLCFLEFVTTESQHGDFRFYRYELFRTSRFGIAQYLLDQAVVAIQYQVEHVGHFTIETHARLDAGHVFHTAHVFGLCDDNRRIVFAQCVCFYVEFRFLYLRHLSLEQRTEHFLLVVRKFFALLVFLHNQAVYDVAIHTGEVTLFELLFQHVDHRYVQLAVHEQYVVAFVLGRIDVSVLFVQVVGVEVNQATVLVGLIILNQCLVFFEGVILVVCILEQSKLGSLFIEIFLSQHTVVDENLQVVPFLFKFLTVVLEDRL